MLSYLERDAQRAVRAFTDTVGIENVCDGLVLLAIDESHMLNESTDHQSLRSVLRALVDVPIFAVFISTEPPTFDRDFSSFLTPHTPYIALPFDVYKDHIIIENERTIDDVCELSFLCRFGRPL